MVGIPTDIWLIQLDGFGGVEGSPLGEDSEATDEEEEGDENKDTDGRQQQQSNSLLGELEDREDMLDCALPRYQECVMVYPGNDRQRPNGGGKQKEEGKKEEGNSVDLSPSSMVISRLSYHRPRYMVSEVKLLSAGETWVELLVVAGRSACLYRMTNLQDGTNEDAVGSIKTTRQHGRGRQQGSANGGRGGAPEAAVLVPLAEIGVNTNVLATAKGNSPEFPWVYFLTLSGIEVRAREGVNERVANLYEMGTRALFPVAHTIHPHTHTHTHTDLVPTSTWSPSKKPLPLSLGRPTP